MLKRSRCKISLSFTFVVAFSILSIDRVWATDTEKPISEGASSVAAQEPSAHSELVLRLGNETNPVDGPFGPFTYGARANHTFLNHISAEAGYIRLHEPHTLLSSSVLDEAQFTIKSPETEIASQTLIIDVTAWQNRMIDMYTNLFGLEVTRTGTLSTSLGVYLGSANRNDDSGRFIGGQLSFSRTFGPVEFGIAFMSGRINNGYYQKIALETSIHLLDLGQLPLTLTFGIEDRKFDFGSGRSVSDPQDEFIFVTGLELHLEKILF